MEKLYTTQTGTHMAVAFGLGLRREMNRELIVRLLQESWNDGVELMGRVVVPMRAG